MHPHPDTLTAPDSPQAPGAFRQAAAEAAQGGDWLGAVAQLTMALAQEGPQADLYVLRARALRAMGQWREVLSDADEALTLGEATGEAHALRAAALALTGQTDEAIAALRAARAAGWRTHADTLLLGALLSGCGDTAAALALYDEELEAEPEWAEALMERGRLRHKLHDEAGAAADLRRALQLRPQLAQRIDGTFRIDDRELGAPRRGLRRT